MDSMARVSRLLFFFFNDTATTEIYTLSLHDALPIWPGGPVDGVLQRAGDGTVVLRGHEEHGVGPGDRLLRSEEHTSELQSRQYLVCRLLLEKKNKVPYRSVCILSSSRHSTTYYHCLH